MTATASLAPYRAGGSLVRRPAFWLAFLRETFGARRVGCLAAHLAVDHLAVDGLSALPPEGPFVLAANHFRGGHTLDVLAAVLRAAMPARPDLADDLLVVVGGRHRPPRGPARRALGAPGRAVTRRWRDRLVRLPLGQARPSIEALRAWRSLAGQRPTIVFPEGRAALAFGPVRPGSGRWLGALGVPVIPTAVWRRDGRWSVRFGPPIDWSARPALRDAQLGLNIAALLPPDLVEPWAELLDRWRAVHAPIPVSSADARGRVMCP